MILGIVLSCIILMKAHELVAPQSDRLTNNEVAQMQLMFSGSHGIVHALPDKAFTGTSHSEHHSPHLIRMGSAGYWAGKKGGTNAVTIDMTSSFLVTGVVTKGIYSYEFIKTYSVMTSQNGFKWRSQGDFVGNFDGETVCKVQFDRPVRARFVKFTVKQYAHHPSMKVDVLVYDIDGNDNLISELQSV